MSGLSSLLTNQTVSQTTLPKWYDTAQQNAVNMSTTGVNNMPALNDTVAGTAINNLSNPATNPFTQAQGTLNTIATGAANPWLTDPTTGAVKPNTNTAMGGLFQAQNDQLHNLIPQIVAPSDAGSIAGGNFGSLRGDTAADTALTNAQGDLFTKQMQEALSNQQTGVNAANALTNVGTQGTSTESTLGQLQQTDPTRQATALTALLGNIKPPATVTATEATSPLTQAGQLAGIYNNLPPSITTPINNAGQSILDAIFGSGSTPNSTNPISGIPNIDTSGATPGTFPTILGSGPTDPTNTSVYSPIDTTIGSTLMGALGI